MWSWLIRIEANEVMSTWPTPPLPAWSMIPLPFEAALLLQTKVRVMICYVSSNTSLTLKQSSAGRRLETAATMYGTLSPTAV